MPPKGLKWLLKWLHLLVGGRKIWNKKEEEEKEAAIGWEEANRMEDGME